MCLLLTLMSVTLASGTLAQSKKPKLPPGLDPGGPAVVVLTSGIDYTRPDVASRLARDGEGDLIGWDTIDNDNRPYDVAGGGTALVLALLQAKGLRVIPIRVATDTPASLATALQLVAQMPARVVIVPQLPGEQTQRATFLAAAAQLRDRLFIVTSDALTGDARSGGPNGVMNILRVAAASDTPTPPEPGLADVYMAPATDGTSRPVIDLIPALFACPPRALAHLTSAAPKLGRLISVMVHPPRTSNVEIDGPCGVSASKR